MSITARRFDMERPPERQRRYLTPLAWLLSFPETAARGLRIRREGMRGLKPPYLLLCTHMAFLDFKVTTAAIFPHRANYVVAIDGFIGREGLLRKVGCVCKRKFVNDVGLVRQIRTIVRDHGDICAIYPEARYAYAGVDSVLPDSLGKMAKLLGAPVVVLNMRGNYLNSPVWDLRKRGNRIEATMTRIASAGEIASLDVAELNERIRRALRYDEYAWQRDQGIRIRKPWRAEGLHSILYKCPACLAESRMESSGAKLSCGSCGKSWTMTELGQLTADSGPTEFPHIPDWFEWERAGVRAELEAGSYSFEDEVRVEWLPNAEGYIDLGRGKLRHDADGFVLEGDLAEGRTRLVKPPESMYTAHIEFNYLGTKGDCIDLSTPTDTYYLYPLARKNVVMKLVLAVEELHKMARGRPRGAQVGA